MILYGNFESIAFCIIFNMPIRILGCPIKKYENLLPVKNYNWSRLLAGQQFPRASEKWPIGPNVGQDLFHVWFLIILTIKMIVWFQK